VSPPTRTIVSVTVGDTWYEYEFSAYSFGGEECWAARLDARHVLPTDEGEKVCLADPFAIGRGEDSWHTLVAVAQHSNRVDLTVRDGGTRVESVWSIGPSVHVYMLHNMLRQPRGSFLRQ
jgi:hypothetical protein